MANIKIGDITFPNDTTEILVPINGSTELQSFIIPSGTKIIVGNGTTDVRAYDRVTVNVPLNYEGNGGGSSIEIENGTMTVSATKGSVSNNQVVVTPKTQVTKAGYFSQGTTNGNGVIVSASELVTTNYPSTITSNGNYNVTNYGNITVNVPTSDGATINNQTKTVTPTKSTQTISYDSGYTGLGTVTVNPIPNDYIIPSGNKLITANGSNIDVKQFSTVTVNVPTSGGTGSSVEIVNETIRVRDDGAGNVVIY